MWMCSEFSSLVQRHLHKAVEKASTEEKLQCEYNGIIEGTYATCPREISIFAHFSKLGILLSFLFFSV